MADKFIYFPNDDLLHLYIKFIKSQCISKDLDIEPLTYGPALLKQ